MTKIYKMTGNPFIWRNCMKYWTFADSLMYDPGDALYYRDGRYVYAETPKV